MTIAGYNFLLTLPQDMIVRLSHSDRALSPRSIAVRPARLTTTTT